MNKFFKIIGSVIKTIFKFISSLLEIILDICMSISSVIFNIFRILRSINNLFVKLIILVWTAIYWMYKAIEYIFFYKPTKD